MQDFFHTLFTFPTVFFSGLLLLVLLYWIIAILGIVDMDILDNHFNGGVELEGEQNPSTSAALAFLTKLKLDGIPLTISLSVIILFSWLLSFIAVSLIYPTISESWIMISLALWILILVPIIATLITIPLLQPLKKLFKDTITQNYATLLGKIAIVRSHKVNEDFGEAQLEDGGAGLLLKIRATTPNTIARGDAVVLHRYDKARNIYDVQPQA